MQSLNFEYLRPTWPQLAELGGLAEAHIYSDPAAAVNKMRSFVEQLMSGLYRELKLETPPQPRLVELLGGDEFRALVPRAVVLKLDAIRIHGNKASHGSSVTIPTAQGLLKELFAVAKWFFVAHIRGALSNISDFRLPQRPQQASELSKRDHRATLLKIAAQEAQLQALLKQVEEANAARQILEQQATELRIELKARGERAANELGFDEAKTRRWLIDTQLVASGFNVGAEGANTTEVSQEVEVEHQPTDSTKGAADYVIWDDNGKPLAVIEAKRTAEDPARGKVQARIYADGLQKTHRHRPIILYTNGFDIWLWDDAQGYPPRKIYGFYSKDSLQQLIFQRGNRRSLNTLSPKKPS
jgi:type I restriction enzyme, R subunit